MFLLVQSAYSFLYHFPILPSLYFVSGCLYSGVLRTQFWWVCVTLEELIIVTVLLPLKDVHKDGKTMVHYIVHFLLGTSSFDTLRQLIYLLACIHPRAKFTLTL